jgi:hypothetical protein
VALEPAKPGVAWVTGRTTALLDTARNRYPSPVTTHQAPLRTLLRRAVLALAASLVAVVALPATAMADTPAAWEKAPHVSGLEFLLVLVLIPLGIALVISVLAVLPSLIHDRGYEPGQSWRAEAEWFGGPRKGVDAADDLSPKQIETAESGRGGTSAEW